MNEFLEALIGLRDKAGSIAKGTLKNMGNVREREQQMLDSERDRNTDLISNAFGSPEAYRQFLEEQPPLPETPGQKLGGFLERLMQLRGGDNN